MKRIISALALFAAISAPISAFADCTTPASPAGGTFYNTTVNAVQFCDGTDWYNTGLVVAGATGTACTNPVGPEGSAYYNTTQNTIQFCNGDDWVNMGTMQFPTASGTACTVPTGPEGTMFFNTTVSKMQFCNGDDWVNATYIQLVAAILDGTETYLVLASDAQANDEFGSSVSLDGDYAIVGSPQEDTGVSNGGAAYIYKKTGGVWAEEAKIAPSVDGRFGQAVYIQGDRAIIGAYGDDTGAANSGAAYIYKRTGTSWAQETKFQASDRAASDQFGWSVAMDGEYAIIGARMEVSTTSQGAAYIFKRTGTSWAQEDKFQASDKQASDEFSKSVAISGDYAVVGARYEDTGGSNAGAIYVFKRTGVSWAEEAKVQTDDKDTNDKLGVGVAIDGDYIIAGAFGEGGSNQGAAYIFKRSGTTWPQQAKLTASDIQAQDYFGGSVSIRGSYAIVGATEEDTGASNAGAAYIFKRSGTSWVEDFKIQASNKSATDFFGASVSTDGDSAIVGAYWEDTGGADAGAAYIFD